MKSKNVIAILFLFVAPTLFSQGLFKEPVLNTSAGQSADVKLVKLVAKKSGIDAETKLMATESDLSGAKTLIIVPGFSSKGLGAAGVSQEDEMARVTKLIKKTKDLGIPIVMVHVGGLARRGGQSDGFCRLVAENSKYMIVVSQGNEDGYFTDISKKKSIPLKIVDKISDIQGPLEEIFGK